MTAVSFEAAGATESNGLAEGAGGADGLDDVNKVVVVEEDVS